jgi:hypothetical protein
MYPVPIASVFCSSPCKRFNMLVDDAGCVGVLDLSFGCGFGRYAVEGGFV